MADSPREVEPFDQGELDRRMALAWLMNPGSMPLTSSLLLMALIALVAALAGAAICYEVVCRRTARGNEQTVRQQKAELQAMTRRIIRLQEDQ